MGGHQYLFHRTLTKLSLNFILGKYFVSRETDIDETLQPD